MRKVEPGSDESESTHTHVHYVYIYTHSLSLSLSLSTHTSCETLLPVLLTIIKLASLLASAAKVSHFPRHYFVRKHAPDTIAQGPNSIFDTSHWRTLIHEVDEIGYNTSL
jgi:hypothetical protein